MRMDSLRMIIVLSWILGLALRQCDVVTAYLTSYLNERIYMWIPEGLGNVTSILPTSSPTSLTGLAYWPPHQPPYQPSPTLLTSLPSPTLLTSLHQPRFPASTNLAYQPSHQPLPLANSRWDARLKIMYIYGTYIPPLERASLSSFLNQALNTITQVLLTFYCSPSHNIPNLSISATLPSTIPLLPLLYCNPSCCPLASLAITLTSM